MKLVKRQFTFETYEHEGEMQLDVNCDAYDERNNVDAQLDVGEVQGLLASMVPKKYYFISYKWSRHTGEWHNSQDVTDKHPLDWMRDNKSEEEEWVLVFWEEIILEMFNEYTGEF